ncbi:GLPGLI family protein [Chryseobacterium gleum]|uniref:GLPGLI family protein n=1 Tax=Chryseobacterium gleum TaxID=250 RepID=UPI00103F3E9D|nr:GLPGLI family protein [Chryseobacterium gleum]QBJ86329.1 GLPGLI family protein [Chryseobacterium gleum]
MKKHFIIFVLILSSFIYGQQSIQVTYETINKPKINYNGFTLSQNQKEEIERQVLQNAKKPEKYVLYYDDGNSFFERDPNEKLSPREQKTEFFRLSNKKGYYRLRDYIVEEFYGYYPVDDVSIEYTDEKQTIENYNCKAALYKNGDIVSKVWYTEDIPVSAGPYDYYNVPGLILKVESPNILCYAVNISKKVDKKEVKRMDSALKVYEGDELKRKIAEGREKMIGSSQKKAEELMKTIQNK